jgi:hypothetical protein
MSPVRTGQMSCDVEHTLSCCATHDRSTIAPRVNQLGVVRVGKSLPEWLIEDDAAGHPHVDVVVQEGVACQADAVHGAGRVMVVDGDTVVEAFDVVVDDADIHIGRVLLPQLHAILEPVAGLAGEPVALYQDGLCATAHIDADRPGPDRVVRDSEVVSTTVATRDATVECVAVHRDVRGPPLLNPDGG